MADEKKVDDRISGGILHVKAPADAHGKPRGGIVYGEPTRAQLKRKAKAEAEAKAKSGDPAGTS